MPRHEAQRPWAEGLQVACRMGGMADLQSVYQCRMELVSACAQAKLAILISTKAVQLTICCHCYGMCVTTRNADHSFPFQTLDGMRNEAVFAAAMA